MAPICHSTSSSSSPGAQSSRERLQWVHCYLEHNDFKDGSETTDSKNYTWNPI